jgi:hypothetical protein
MLDFRPLVARFVDDVFRALRHASLEELRELLGPPTPAAPAARRSLTPPAASPRARRPRKAAPAAERPLWAEITDPERLLAAILESPMRAVPPPSTPAVADSEAPREQAPNSTERPTTAALRAGETLARASGGGMVIRRTRKA